MKVVKKKMHGNLTLHHRRELFPEIMKCWFWREKKEAILLIKILCSIKKTITTLLKIKHKRHKVCTKNNKIHFPPFFVNIICFKKTTDIEKYKCIFSVISCILTLIRVK